VVGGDTATPIKGDLRSSGSPRPFAARDDGREDDPAYAPVA